MSLCLLLKSSWDRYFEPCYSRLLKSNVSFTNVRLITQPPFLIMSILHIWVSHKWTDYAPHLTSSHLISPQVNDVTLQRSSSTVFLCTCQLRTKPYVKGADWPRTEAYRLCFGPEQSICDAIGKAGPRYSKFVYNGPRKLCADNLVFNCCLFALDYRDWKQMASGRGTSLL